MPVSPISDLRLFLRALLQDSYASILLVSLLTHCRASFDHVVEAVCGGSKTALPGSLPAPPRPSFRLPNSICLADGSRRFRIGVWPVTPFYALLGLTSYFGQNDNYYNPPNQRRQFRDPYGEWWDKQDRRNFGEPVHEDNDILTILSPEEYTHFKPAKAFFLLGCAATAVLTLSGVVSLYYSDKPSVPRTFPDGLEKELGGPSTMLARKPGEDKW
ncbi:hypothetical protein AJ79_05502 [Helicocarpus griseus UAMH5409]|uniref:Uncharacterized protein n=1 Tax=Helicocarpus griseus UAMH5409 TaxID=1447875 RepID=A0A2B7XNM1_9EURO|nr:hypothetical protein AJ79_05502 [Helicocarpus griseus UAMH5409]